MSGERTPEEEETVVQKPERAEIELVTLSSYSLNHRVIPNCFLSAVLEPNGPEVIVCVTSSNKILIKDSENSLNIQETIRCISTAPFGKGYDFLVIGTDAHVICYDVHNNQTIFRKEVTDGVNCFAVGKVADHPPAIYCGGNCCIWGFDADGNNNYWTVTGDVVSTICILDYDEDGENEIIIGSPDFEIRVFKNDLMRAEIMEVDAVLLVSPLQQGCFAYVLSNGTVGVYRRDYREWRIKSKSNVTSMVHHPAGMLTCVWNSGKIDVRCLEDGDVQAKISGNNGQVVGAAFIKEKDEICVAFGDGTVKCYRVQKQMEKVDKTQDVIREYGQLKHSLMMELTNYESEEQMTDAEKEREQRIPIDTKVDMAITVEDASQMCYISIHVSNNVYVRAVVIFGEGMYQSGESFAWIPKDGEQGDTVMFPLIPEKDAPSNLHIKVFVGYLDSYKLTIFEMHKEIKRFNRLVHLPHLVDASKVKNYVEFNLKIPQSRLSQWIEENFMVVEDSKIDEVEDIREVQFFGCAPRKGEHLIVRVDKQENKMSIHNDDIETVGNVIQSLTESCQILSLESRAHFPEAFKETDEILAEIDAMTDVRDRLTAELQERQSIVKETLVRAEDAIAIDNMPEARKYYTRLRQMDAAARQAALLRWNNNERCVKSLRRLNKLIETASKLRAGEASRQVVIACRNALADDNKQVVTKIMEYGAAK